MDTLVRSTALAALALGAAGAWGIARQPRADATATEALAGLPGERVALGEIVAGRVELVDPTFALPRTHHFDRAALRAALSTCDPRPDLPPALARTAAWSTLRCAGELPDADWLAAGPAMHPLGTSYASMAVDAGLDPTIAAPHRHLVERGLPPGALQAMLAGEPLVDGGDPVWLRTPESAASLPVYRQLDGASVDAALATAGLSRRACASPWCDTRVPQPAWPVAALATSTLLSFLALLGTGGMARRRRQQEADRRAFVLRTLTHELRTPATAIGLAADALRDAVDALPEPSLRALGTLLDANTRLRETLDATAAFVALHQRQPRVRELPDLAAWLRDVTDAELTVGDAPFRTDPDWLALALGNLVGNAHRHGVPPVRITAHRQGDVLRIEVRDAGRPPALATLQPFVRGSDSDGLGLGLSLAAAVADALGGELSLEGPTTTFVLTVRSQP
jgi:signal transduction histidine kinase